MSIPRSDVEMVQHIMAKSNMMGILEDGMRRNPRGLKSNRKPLELFFLGSFLSVMHGHGFKVTAIHKTLTTELPVDIQFELGVIERNIDSDGPHIELMTRHELYNAVRVLKKQFAYGFGSAPELDDVERRRRHRVICDVTDALCDVFIDPTITADGEGFPSVITALDATGYWSWGKGKYDRHVVGEKDEDAESGEDTADTSGADPAAIPAADEPTEVQEQPADREAADADTDEAVAEGQEGAENDEAAEGQEAVETDESAGYDPDAQPGAKTHKSGRKENFFGYHEHTLVRVPQVTYEGEGKGRQKVAESEPALISRFELTPASYDVVDVSLSLIDRLRARITDLLVDKHYSYKKLVRWKNELSRRGIKQHLDLRDDEHGAIYADGVIYLDGQPFCQHMPLSLHDLRVPGPNATFEEKQESWARFALRESYALIYKVRPDGDGKMIGVCPALKGVMGCPRRAGTVEAANAVGLASVNIIPGIDDDDHPAVCTQTAVTLHLPAKVHKSNQYYLWGSKDWDEYYGKRTYVEGSYGNRKNDGTEDVRRGYSRFPGIMMANLGAGIAVVSYNLRMTRNWHERTAGGNPFHPLLAEPTPDYGFMMLSEAERDAVIESRRDLPAAA
ncbi:MAG TPA: hypothetical protein VHV57_12230 [Acidimicrobiales bacterium]|jgi:hypothetical protein|nr:hypothetical protein [Acidimicrobiales bacterium]